nr:hypothetical protein GCM10020093_034240 [Planobispora longispora]
MAGFADFAVWEREAGVSVEGLAFWREVLRGLRRCWSCRWTVPGRHDAQGRPTGCRCASPEAMAAFRRAGATPFMGVLAGVNVVLSRYCGTTDVVVGTFTTDRATPELEDLVGFFVNTVVLRTDLSGDPGFAEVLARSRAVTLSALAHQDVPFDRVVEEAAPPRTPVSRRSSRSPSSCRTHRRRRDGSTSTCGSSRCRCRRRRPPSTCPSSSGRRPTAR